MSTPSRRGSTTDLAADRPQEASARGGRHRLVHELVTRRAELQPEAPAVVCGGELATYGELAGRASRLARRLAALGVGPEVPVGLCLERSVAAVTGLLGILEAGGVYLPLDPELPAERLATLSRDARPRVVVTREELAGRLPWSDIAPGVRLVRLDTGCGLLADGEMAPAAMIPPEAAAYLIYTSGSTGAPKGIAVPHREIARHAVAVTRRLGLGPDDRVLQFYGLSFDLSLEQTLPPLVAGASVALRGAEPWGAADFAARVAELGLTMASLPPGYFREVAREWAGCPERPGDTLRIVSSGGERMDPAAVALWRRGPWRAVRLLNGYGPTEATITATFHEVPPGLELEGGERVPIGRPLPGRTAFVLWTSGGPAPAGEAGELALGGRGLARGYLGRPASTAERFVPDPWSGVPGARLYRTGDLVQEVLDPVRPGAPVLDFLGRLDDQVKIRGFRVELGEVEAALARQPEVRRAAVVVREDGPDERRLVAYVAAVSAVGPRAPGLAATLRARLAAELPAYMVPSSLVLLDELPTTPGGKVDRRALPAPGRDRPEIAVAERPPRGPVEEVLAAIWVELFGLERVGVDDPFVELGGHSLAALRLAARVRDALGVDLPLHDPFAVPTIAELARAIEQGSARAVPAPRIPRLPRGGPLPVSSSQERAWFVHRLEPSSRAYQTQFAYLLRGPLSVPALGGALAAIVDRHEVYRTTFPAPEGRPVQLVHPAGRPELPLVDLEGLPGGRGEGEAHRLIADAMQRPFDLERLPLIRWALARLGPAEHRLAIVEHHVVHDGWSTNVLTRELVELYRAALAGAPSPLPAPAIQFGDFAAWQRGWLGSAEAAAQLDFWRSALAGLRPLALPGDRPRPKVPSFRGDAPRFDLPGPLAGALRTLARQRGATLFATVLAAFDALLHRYTGEDDLAVGSGVANRRHAATEGLIGMVVNNVVLRVDLDGDPTFEALVGRAMRVAVAAWAHQDLPFDKVVEALRPERSLSHNPLFQVMLSFHDSAMPELALPGLEAAVEGLIANGSAKFDLNVIMIPRADQARTWSGGARPDWITVSWEYSADLFDPPTIARMIGHFRSLLEGAVADPGRRISELPLLTAEEERQLLGWAATELVEASATLDETFFAQARQRPDAVAVVAGGAHLTYGALAASALALAARLRSLGIGPEDPVALCLERSPALVTAILGVLAAGGAYVPLDPAHPQERLEATLRDAAPKALVTEGALRDRFAAFDGAVLDADELADPAARGDAAAAYRSAVGAERLAYVIYTSGSTAAPKGVMVSHANVLRLLAGTRERFGFGPRDTWTLFHSYAFDFSVWELWGALALGGRLVVVPWLTSRSPDAFLRLLADEGVTVLNQTPSAFRELARADELAGPEPPPLSLRHVIFGGEVLDVGGLASWLERRPERPELVNMYGITETTVHVTWRWIGPADVARPGASPIGRPLPDLEVLLLDRRSAPVPVGVPGEICVGGAGLARGYLGRPAATAERFVPHPLAPETGARLYRSGDLARRRPDGELEYLGRIDHQVKVRGFRVEPGEIEAALGAHPGVRRSVVVARPDAAGERRLVAYVVPAAETAPSAAELKALARSRLPEHMVPSAFVVLPELPLTPNGKLDRQALPEPGAERPDLATAYVAPRTPTEARLAALWAELLGVERVGVTDDFFDLGGYSLLGMRLLHRVREALGAELPLADLFAEPTVEGLAQLADGASPPAAAADPLSGMSQEAVDELLAELLAAPVTEGGGQE